MTTPSASELPGPLAAVLEAAASDAKRRGHAHVTPAHLGAVLAAKPEAGSEELTPEFKASVDAYLASLPRTYETPVVEQSTLDMLLECGKQAAPIDALTDALLELVSGLGQAGQPDQGAAVDPVAATGSAPATQDSAMPGEKAFDLPSTLSGYAAIVDTAAPVVPRTDAVRRVLSLLSARDPQTPLVVAPEGQGRTGLAACIAAFLADPAYSGTFAGWPVVRVRPEGVLARGAGGSLLAVLEACRGKAVVFFDDVEVLCALGSGGRPDGGALSVIRGSLHDPDIRVVLTIAAEFVDRLQTADLELYDELDRVDLIPLTDSEILEVAREAAVELAAYHKVEIGHEVVMAAVSAPRQIDTKGHPSLAVARMDRAAAWASMTDERVTSIDDLGTAVAGQQYLSFDAEGASQRLATFVLGQDDAISRVTNRLAVTRASLDVRPERPDGVFLFAGPTGTGKTELALALAREVFGTSDAIVRVDMSEFADQWSMSKLIGSGPGYVGSTEPESWLTTKIRQRPQCVLLLDEIEKAHPVVWNAFLQVFDAGRMTDGMGRVADFRDVIVVLTTNIGAEQFADRNTPGFVKSEEVAGADERRVREDLKRRMAPELLNRFDDILVFQPLTRDVIRRIVVKQMGAAYTRLEARGWHVTVTDDVIEYLCEHGYVREWGARPLLREIEKNVMGRVRMLPPGKVLVRVADGEVVAESVPAQ